MSTTDKPRRAVIYTRISLDFERERLGVQRQAETCRRWAEANGWTVVDVLEDNSISASSFSRKKRAGFEALLQGITDGTYDGVIAYSMDRLTRKVRELVHLIDVATSMRIPITTTQAGEIDLSTSMGRAHAQFLAIVAELETSFKSERQKAANAQRRAMGRRTSPTAPFGYKLEGKKLVKDPDVQPHLERAFTDVLSKKTSGEVMAQWVAAGLETASQRIYREQERHLDPDARKPAPWTLSTVKKILVNPVYAGLLTHRREVIGTGDWPTYITEEQHHSIKALLSRPQNAPKGKQPTSSYPFSTIVTCSCGRSMTGVHTRGQRNYLCVGRHEKACYARIGADAVERDIDAYLIGVLNELSPSSILDDDVIDRQRSLSRELSAIETERTEYEQNEALSARSLVTVLSRLDARREAAQRELEALTKGNLLAQVVAHVLDWHSTQDVGTALESQLRVAAAYSSLSMEQKRLLATSLGHYVVTAQGRGKKAVIEIYRRDVHTGEIHPKPLNEWTRPTITITFPKKS